MAGLLETVVKKQQAGLLSTLPVKITVTQSAPSAGGYLASTIPSPSFTTAQSTTAVPNQESASAASFIPGIAQSFGRSAADVGVAAGQLIAGAVSPEAGARARALTPTPGPGLLGTLIGNEPVDTSKLADTAASYESGLKKLGITGPAGTTLAVAGSILPDALTFTGLGGESNAIKALVATKDAADAAGILQKMGVHSDLIPSYAEAFAKAGTKAEVETGLEALKKLQAETRLSPGSAQPPMQPQAAELSPLSRTTGQTPGIPPASGGAPSLTPLESTPLPQAKIEPEISQYIKEQIIARETARNIDNSIGNKIKDFLQNAQSKLIDFTSPIENTLKDAMARDKFSLIPSQDIRNQIDNVLRAPTLAGQFAKDGGLVDVIKTVPDVNALDQYLIAKHAIELNTAGIETGRDLIKDEKLVSALAPTYEPFAAKVGDYSRNLLQYAVDSGLVSQKLADELKIKYPDYVPFNRVFGEGELQQGAGTGSKGVASQGSQSVVQKIKGSTRQVESPLESFFAKTNEVFIQGERNKAARLLASYEKLPNNPFELKEIKAMVDDSTGKIMNLPGDESKATISFMDNGEKRTFSTTPEIAQAAKALSVQNLNVLGKILAFPVRIARIGITGINLPFVAANLAKDQITAFINSEKALSTSIANPGNFLRSLFSAVGHDGLYEEMLRAGGGGTSFDISRNQATNTLKSVRAGRNVGSKALYTVTHPDEFLRAVENIVNRGEEATRIQQFRGMREALMKQGMSREEATVAAARAARENTVNFMRRGEWGTVLNSAFLYLNAGIQGTRTFLRALKTRPIQTATKLALVGFTPVAYATFWNLSDPKRAEAYKDISSYEKENNIIIVPPDPVQDADGKWNVIKIPLSQEINNIVGLVRRPIEAMFGMDPVSMGDVATALIGSVSPIKPDLGSIVSTATPQAIKPTIEGVVNQSLFTGIPQVPASLQDQSPKNQFKDTTSGTARKIGEMLNLSPIKVEEWIKGTFGGVGSQALNAVDQALAATGAIPKEQIGGQNILDAITARFSKASGGQTERKAQDEITAFTQKDADASKALTDKATAIWKSVKDLPKDEAKAKLKDAIGQDAALLKKVIDIGEADRLGLQGADKRLKTSSVEVRASFIYLHMNQLPDDTAKKAYLQDLAKKKILSVDVLKQMVEIKKNDTTQKTTATSSPQANAGNEMANVLASLTGATVAHAAEPGATPAPTENIFQQAERGVADLGNKAADFLGGRTRYDSANNPKVPTSIPETVTAEAQARGVQPKLALGLLQVENAKMDPSAVGVSGDIGLFQHNPKTTIPTMQKLYKAEYGKEYDPNNAVENTAATMLYLSILQDRPFIKSTKDLVIAYHLGPTAFLQYKKGTGYVKAGNEYWKKYMAATSTP